MNIAIIPARGQSRRIPRKNIKPFHGKPIIAYSIETARQSGLFDGGVYVSTEDDEIAAVAQHYGAWVVKRPPELAEIGAPDCGTQEVTRHALESLGVTEGLACCIYPCAPLMSADDLRRGLASVERALMFRPPRRRYAYAVGPELIDAGQFYWGAVLSFLSEPTTITSENSIRVQINTSRCCDINTPSDWSIAEAMYAALHSQTSVGIR